ncbi:hypothetical protein ACQKWADRAFT_327437 [Trichoderma austrokoningii]
MDAPGFNEQPMGNFAYYEAPEKRYSISRSPPDSLAGISTPSTPDDGCTTFGQPFAASAAQVSSIPAVTATTVLNTFTHQPVGSLSPVNEIGNVASVSASGNFQQVRGPEVPRFVGSFGLSNPSSQIWAQPPPARLDPGTASAAAAAHARWGSLDTHMNQRDVFTRRESFVSRPSPFVAYQSRFPAAVNAPPNVSRRYNPQGYARRPPAYPMLALQNAPLRYNHEAGAPRMERHMSAASNMAGSAFDLSGLQTSLFSSTGHESVVNQTLGIDVLRISSPRAPPMQQASAASCPASRPAQVPFHAPTGGFLPMQAVMQQTPSRAFTTNHPAGASSTSKFSSRYHGMHTETNASAEHLTPEQNCALWLTNLPSGVSIHQLLKSIRNVGRIWCSYINFPDFSTHATAAAKVVFFTPEAAQQLLSDSWTRGLYVEGQRVRVSHNRIKYASHATSGRMSRVLIITGHADFVNEATLTKFFKDRFIFQLDQVTHLISAGERSVIEFRFGSYRCQSQMGKMSLEKDRPYGLEKVEFGDDPCEVGETMSSYGIAAERIQGRGF